PISAVMGPMVGASIQVAAEIALAEGIVLVSPVSSSITIGADEGWVKHTAPSIAALAAAAAGLVIRNGRIDTYIIHPEDPDAVAFREAYIDAFTGNGRTADFVSYRSDEP